MGDTFTAVLRNEFAVVELEVLEVRGTSVLSIRDPATGASIQLDALEMESLLHADKSFFRTLLSKDEPPTPPGG